MSETSQSVEMADMVVDMAADKKNWPTWSWTWWPTRWPTWCLKEKNYLTFKVVDMVADMGVDIDKVADMFKTKCIKPEMF